MILIEILQNQAEHSAGERNFWKKEKDTEVIQIFLSHGISIPIGSSNEFTKKLVKIFCQNCQIDQSATTVVD